MLITGIGLTVSSILPLHALKIGGRLTHCIAAWKAITENNWVRNIVRFGYKIPLLSKPFQSKIPPNPSTTGGAYDVLVEEASGLLKKGAITSLCYPHCPSKQRLTDTPQTAKVTFIHPLLKTFWIKLYP